MDVKTANELAEYIREKYELSVAVHIFSKDRAILHARMSNFASFKVGNARAYKEAKVIPVRPRFSVTTDIITKIFPYRKYPSGDLPIDWGIDEIKNYFDYYVPMFIEFVTDLLPLAKQYISEEYDKRHNLMDKMEDISSKRLNVDKETYFVDAYYYRKGLNVSLEIIDSNRVSWDIEADAEFSIKLAGLLSQERV